MLRNRTDLSRLGRGGPVVDIGSCAEKAGPCFVAWVAWVHTQSVVAALLPHRESQDCLVKRASHASINT